ncbi:MAG TPA: hypothetical protein VI431_02915 [Candidatus Acidoferrum sp.]
MQPLAESISCDFQLSFEDWLDSRDIHETHTKELKRHQADYLLFNAERRSFFANEQGWNYTSAASKETHDWDDLIGVAYKQRVVTLMAANGHYHLPRSALDANQLATLVRWLSLAMGES